MGRRVAFKGFAWWRKLFAGTTSESGRKCMIWHLNTLEAYSPEAVYAWAEQTGEGRDETSKTFLNYRLSRMRIALKFCSFTPGLMLAFKKRLSRDIGILIEQSIAASDTQ